MRFSEDTLDRIFTLTKIDVATLLSDYVDFTSSDSLNIWNYYRGKITTPIMTSFTRLERLTEEFDILVRSMCDFKETLSTTDFWEVLEIAEDCRLALKTTDNASKWSRSSIVKNNFYNTIQIRWVQSSNQTLEDIALLSGSIDYGNRWVEIAIKNDSREEDYTPDGGYNLYTDANLPETLFLNSVVDNLYGERVYGLDIYKYFTFEDDDLKVLTYRETLEQSVDILMNLEKGDDPFNKGLGIRKSLIVGGNRNSLSFPIIFRQLSSSFSTDDTLSSFKLLDLTIEGDSVNLQMSVRTKFGATVEKNIVI